MCCVLDYEVNHVQSITLTARDNGYPQMSSSTEVVVRILDEDDNVPTFLKSVCIIK